MKPSQAQKVLICFRNAKPLVGGTGFHRVGHHGAGDSPLIFRLGRDGNAAMFGSSRARAAERACWCSPATARCSWAWARLPLGCKAAQPGRGGLDMTLRQTHARTHTSAGVDLEKWATCVFRTAAGAAAPTSPPSRERVLHAGPVLRPGKVVADKIPLGAARDGLLKMALSARPCWCERRSRRISMRILFFPRCFAARLAMAHAQACTGTTAPGPLRFATCRNPHRLGTTAQVVLVTFWRLVRACREEILR